MSDSLKDIKSMAIQMEVDGIKFYSDLAAKTLHPMGRAMFKSFVEDEKLHAKRLRALLSTQNEIIQEKGIKFYEQAAKESQDKKDSETYRFLAGEEKTHFSILKNTLEYLENNERREAESEGRIYDMWMKMVNKKL